MTYKKNNKLTMILFAIYFCILIWILLFKMSFSFEEIDRSRSINLIPFYGSTIVNGKVYINEIINNILIFIPIGTYICMLRQHWSIIKKISVAFFISLIIEILQFILAIGVSDITDLLGNTLGAIIGIGVFYLFVKVFKTKTKMILNCIASIATIGLISFLSIIILSN